MINMKNLEALDYINEGVIIIDENFNIVHGNKVINSWVRNKVSENISKSLFDAFPELLDKKIHGRLKSFFPHMIPLVFSSLIHKSFINTTKEKYHHTVVRTFEFENSIKVYGIITIQDVTDLALTTVAAKEASRKLERDSMRRLKFLSNMSHELRTSLNGVVGVSQLLSSSNLDSQQAIHVKTIQGCSNSLMEIINNYFNYVSTDTNALNISESNQPFCEILETTVNMQSSKARDKKIGLICQLDDCLKRKFFKMDHEKIKQIILSLVSNAIKCTDSGNVIVSAISNSLDEKHTEVSISVSDAGPGAIGRDVEMLFNSNAKESELSNIHFNAAGLGVSICKKIITSMDGTMTVASVLDKGCTYTFKLVLEDNPDKVIIGSDDDKKYLSNLNILLVDDNEINQVTTKQVLENLDAHVIIATDGQDAIDILYRNEVDFDVILMDYRMPIFDGVEATRYIKTYMKDLISTPIIMVSANALDEDIKRFNDCGVDNQVSKPFTTKRLVTALAELKIIQQINA